MERHSEAVAVIDRPQVTFCKPEAPPKVTLTPFSNFAFGDRLLLLVGSVVGYAFGAYIGFAVGWLAGFILGSTYAEYFRPVYVYDLNQLSYWELLLCRVAIDCAIVGVIVGVVIIEVAERWLLRHNIISLCDKGITDPKVIANRLGKSEKQIQKLIKKQRKF